MKKKGFKSYDSKSDQISMNNDPKDSSLSNGQRSVLSRGSSKKMKKALFEHNKRSRESSFLKAEDCSSKSSADGNVKKEQIYSPDHIFKLPGGYVQKVSLANCSENITRRVRAYLDELFGSISLNFDGDSKAIIPAVLQDILAYNNVYFSTVDSYDTVEAPEPVWFHIDTYSNHLRLFVNHQMYNEYILHTRPDTPVNWSDGILRVEKYDPHEVAPNTIEDVHENMMALKLALIVDHVAQHILHEIYVDKDDRIMTSGIHEGWTNCPGTTLHSMLNIEIITCNAPPRRKTGSYNHTTTVISHNN
ncbi:unnamed protein product [Bemisia tabaci]|uniref:Uncharacterized protein n=1 Tax=Bemisia tabaci TaxID=7038 RepID=A0A9P0AHY7_BEMTA|nr:unnamed protein product [Bemisia tabaci]